MSEGEVDAIRTFAVGRAGMDLGRAPRGVLDELGLEPAAWDELSRRCRAALDGSGRDRPSRCRALREAYRGEIASLLGVEASPSAIATPKQASRLAPAASSVRPPAAPVPEALPLPPPSDLDETGGIDLARLRAAVLPFRAAPTSRPDPTELPMPLERYAAIGAALAAPGDPGPVLSRFGLRRETWDMTIRQMASAFEARPELKARYRELIASLLGRRSM